MEDRKILEMADNLLSTPGNTLLVKNLPRESSDELLENYLEVVSGAEVVTVCFQPQLNPDSCLVQFEEEFSDAAINAIQEKCRGKPLKGNIVEIEKVSLSRGILVTNLTTHTQDLLELYFDNESKSGGGDVVKVTPHEDVGMAIVEFQQPEVVKRVVERTHTLSEVQLKVDVYIQGFHGPWIEKLKTRSRQPKPDDAKSHHEPNRDLIKPQSDPSSDTLGDPLSFASPVHPRPVVHSPIESQGHQVSYENVSITKEMTSVSVSSRNPDKPSVPPRPAKPPGFSARRVITGADNPRHTFEGTGSHGELPARSTMSINLDSSFQDDIKNEKQFLRSDYNDPPIERPKVPVYDGVKVSSKVEMFENGQLSKQHCDHNEQTSPGRGIHLEETISAEQIPADTTDIQSTPKKKKVPTATLR